VHNTPAALAEAFCVTSVRHVKFTGVRFFLTMHHTITPPALTQLLLPTRGGEQASWGCRQRSRNAAAWVQPDASHPWQSCGKLCGDRLAAGHLYCAGPTPDPLSPERALDPAYLRHLGSDLVIVFRDGCGPSHRQQTHPCLSISPPAATTTTSPSGSITGLG